MAIIDEHFNCITFWYPMLKQIRMRVPKTFILYTDVEFIRWFDGEKPDGVDEFIEDLTRAIERMGMPCFLRTGQTSAKHDWKSTCYIDSLDNLDRHVFNIVEQSELSSLIGLSCNVWAVRELIPTTPLFHAFSGNMPITREFRVFIYNGGVECIHPYWPKEAFLNHADDKIWKPHIKKLQQLMKKDRTEITKMAKYIAEYIPGYWSVDFLQDSDGEWWVTDMALGRMSWHWPGCKKAKKEK